MNTRRKGKSGYVFNIQRYSLHDGPGIRTVVFLKGCPLRCRWCSNPESQKPLPELAYNTSKCIGCNGCSRCNTSCVFGAIGNNESGCIHINRDNCRSCFKCVEQCPSKALHIFGREMHVSEIIKTVEADSAFYARSGGGLTISGGEPLMQSDFVVELVKEAKKHRIDTTMETCGYAPWEIVKSVAENLSSSIIYDIKSMNSAKHKQYTGVANELIVNNLIRLRHEFPKLNILVRTPVIPGFNDSKSDISAIVDFISTLPNTSYALLPYHRLGQQKYEYLGRVYPLGDARLNMELLQELISLA